MAKKQSDSKIAVAGALALVMAVAGVMLVKEPLRSSRPVGGGLQMDAATGEYMVRARLWEDPIAAVQRSLKEPHAVTSITESKRSLSQRLRPLRRVLADRAKSGARVTVLLVTTSGGPYVESAESRIRDRYAIGTALGVACYVPEDEGNLAFVEWDDRGSPGALPYEWYRVKKTRVCGEESLRPTDV
jgi:hypothetical protein